MSLEKVFLLDDDASFALKLNTSLKANGISVHPFSDHKALLDWLPRGVVAGASVVLAKLSDPQRLLGRLIDRCPDLPVIVTIDRPSVSTAVELMHSGAAYVLHKPFSSAQLRRTAQHVLGQRAVPAGSSADLTNPGEDVYRRLRSLSTRQRQILGEVFQGSINKVIAERLGISVKTVELHRSRMMQKMRASSAIELIKMTAPYGALLREQVG